MAILARSVHIRDPKRHRDILLDAGEEPAPEYAALITNPDAWEGGVLPGQDDGHSTTEGQDPKDDGDSADAPTDTEAKPVKKTAATKRAAHRPARGRDAAGEGDSGA